MKKFIVIAILVGLVWFIHYLNPSFDNHKAAISPETALDSEFWDDLQYKDYYLVSFTNNDKGTMVSFGLCKYVNVVDEEWASE